MSRSGYSYDCDNLALYRQAVENAITGKRGQAFLRELLAALDAMPDKRLISDELVDADGAFCTLGVIGAARGVDLKALDYSDPRALGKAFGIARSLAAEIEYENDDDDGAYGSSYDRALGCYIHSETPEARWQRMRRWVEAHIKPGAAA
jgi:hypothetical protein